MKERKLAVYLLVVLAVSIVALYWFGHEHFEEVPVDMRFCMSPGQSVRMRITENVDLKEEGYMGTIIRCESRLDCTMKCLEVEQDGVMRVQQKWDSGAIKGVGPKGRFEYDSLLHPGMGPLEARRLAKLVGNSIEARIKPSGEILELWDGEVIAGAMMSEKGVRKSNIGVEVYELLRTEIVAGVWQSREHLFDAVLRSYPESEVAVSEQWTTLGQAFATRSGLEEIIFTYKGIKEGCACFDLICSVSAGSDMLESLASPAMNVESRLEGTGVGIAEMDVQTGLFTKVQVNMDWVIMGKSQLFGLADMKKSKKITGSSVATLEMLPSNW